MSLKDNITMVKEELNSEEKFFEKAVVTERFVKKYKNLIIGVIVFLVAIIGANIAYELKEQNRITSANEALAKLQNDASNKAALNELKSLSPELHDVWLYSQAIANHDIEALKKLKSTKALIVGDLASYEVAQNTQDIKALDEYSLKQSAIYKDLALVQSAVLLMANNEIDTAREKLSKISKNSSLAKLANALMHYGVK